MRTSLVLATAAAVTLGVLAAAPVTAQPQGHHAVQLRTADTTAAKKKPKVFGTTLGQVGTGACTVGATPGAVVIDTAGVGTPTYVAPADGIITAFSHQANGVSGQVQAIVFADGPTSTQKTVVTKSAKLTVRRNALNSFGVRLPIQKGQRLGLGYTADGMACATPAGFGGDATLVAAPFDPDTTTTFIAAGVLAGGGTTFRPNISAVLESDIDGDGYGDLTQDGCVQSRKVQAHCPDTQITKKPKHKKAHRKAKVKIAFTSTLAGSSFQCRLDGHHKWKGCSSPYKKRLGIGRHVLQVRAVSAEGVPDPKPAKVRFTIRRA